MQHRPFPFGSPLASIGAVSTELIVKEALAGDEEAFAAVIERHRKELRG
jgi:hypothetical protein